MVKYTTLLGASFHVPCSTYATITSFHLVPRCTGLTRWSVARLTANTYHYCFIFTVYLTRYGVTWPYYSLHLGTPYW